MNGDDDAVYSGRSGFRGIVPTEQLTELPDPHAIQFWIGPAGHLLHYAMGRDGQDVNFLAVSRDPVRWTAEDWVVPARDEEDATTGHAPIVSHRAAGPV